jgi:hypothetical protein
VLSSTLDGRLQSGVLYLFICAQSLVRDVPPRSTIDHEVIVTFSMEAQEIQLLNHLFSINYRVRGLQGFIISSKSRPR